MLPSLSFVVLASLGAWPLTGTSSPDTVQDPYGPRLLNGNYDLHRGLDLDADAGDPVHAIADGEVVRIELDTENAGTARERYGTWILVQHADTADGQTSHSGYLHLSDVDVAVGDLVSEGDVLGEVGSSGVGIQTSHLHLNAYEGLTSTSVYKSKQVSPYNLLDYTHEDDITLDIDGGTLDLTCAAPELDIVRIELVGTIDSATLDLETEEGLCDDVATCGDVTIVPGDFHTGDTEAVWTFEATALGTLTEVVVYDVDGEAARWTSGS